MRVLIVGCGYLGQAFAKKLGFAQISIVTRTPKELPYSAFLSDDLESALQGQDIVVVTVAAKDRNSYRETYLKTAERLSSLLPPTCSHLLYTSSFSAYGAAEGTVDENTPLKPQTETSTILAETEKILLDLPCTTSILRLGEIVGPGREIQQRLKKIKSPLPGTGNNRVHISHLDDIVAAMLFLIEKRLGGVFNLCTPEHPTRRELYQKICAHYALPKPTWDPSIPSFHGSEKTVECKKIVEAGFKLTHPTLEFLC